MNAPETTGGPRQLVVLSGKGGTGKTSIVASLATLAENKVLADCDVDAADLHLVLAPQRKKSEAFFAGKEARILEEHCCGCGLCAEHCRFDAISTTESAAGRAVCVVDPIACEGCGLCALVCTCRAVELHEPERGEWFFSDTRCGPLVHARLNIGGENSGKLVTLVRNQAVALAEEIGADLVIADGPPGIGCPVIASVTGADLVLAVTEPTVSGRHDLERLIGLVRRFDIPLAVCLNKCDLNPDMAEAIQEVCDREGLPVVGRIPYDTAVVRAQVEGMSVIEHGDGPVAEEIRNMWITLDEILRSVKG